MARLALAGVACALMLAGCGGGSPAGGDGANTASPSVTRPADETPRVAAVRRCLDRAGLVTTDAIPEGKATVGLLVSPGTALYFYASASAAREDLPAIRRGLESADDVRAVGDVVAVYDTVLLAGSEGRRAREQIEACL